MGNILVVDGFLKPCKSGFPIVGERRASPYVAQFFDSPLMSRAAPIYKSMFLTSPEWDPPPYHWIAPSCAIECRGVSPPRKLTYLLIGQPPMKMKIFWPYPNSATLPSEMRIFWPLPDFRFSRFQIKKFRLLSNYVDIEKYINLQGIKIIEETSVINYLSW